MVKLVVIASLVLFAAICVIATSPDQYIDGLIANSQSSIDKACIIKKDGSRWTSKNQKQAMEITACEIETISDAFKIRPVSLFTFLNNGILVGKDKYSFLQWDNQMLLAGSQHYGSVILKVTKTAIVIAHVRYRSDISSAKKATDHLAKELMELGL